MVYFNVYDICSYPYLFDLTCDSCNLSCSKCELVGVKIVYVWISLMCYGKRGNGIQ